MLKFVSANVEAKERVYREEKCRRFGGTEYLADFSQTLILYF